MAKKKRTLLYAGSMLAGALIVVALSLLLKLYLDMDDQIREVKQQLNQVYETEDRAGRAAELLVLAQDAFYRGDSVQFHAYMAMLGGYEDALSEKTYVIYDALQDELS